jgi:hypothetical protein
MKWTLKAILARFGGDREKAIDYCYDLVDTYPRLRAEYSTIVDALTGHEEKAKGAYATAS